MIDLQSIKWQGLADGLAHFLVFRPPADDLAVDDVDVGNVRGQLEIAAVSGDRQTVTGKRVAEIACFHEIIA